MEENVTRLQAVFPHVPAQALRTILEMCERDLGRASTWVLENDFTQVLQTERAGEEDPVTELSQQTDISSVGDGTIAAASQESQPSSVTVTRDEHTNADADAPDNEDDEYEYEEDSRSEVEVGEMPADGGAERNHSTTVRVVQDSGEASDNDRNEEQDEDERDEEEEEEPHQRIMFALNDDDGDVLFIRPRKRARKRIQPTKERVKRHGKEARFWVRFDDQLMLKTHLELINITLRNCAHHSVALLNVNASFIDEDEARQRLTRFSAHVAPLEARPRGALGKPSFAEETTAAAKAVATGRGDGVKNNGSGNGRCVAGPRKLLEVGYWSYFFDIDDIDEVWRSMCSRHLFGQGQLGDVFEICTCHGVGQGGGISASRSAEAFDVVNSYCKARRASSACVIVPCENNESVMTVAGSALYRALLLRNDPIYFRYRTTKETSAALCPADCAKVRCKHADDFFAFFRVVSRDEHMLASQYKIQPAYSRPRQQQQQARHKCQASSSSSATEIPARHTYGSFRLRPPQFQHEDEKFTLSKLAGVCWRPVD